MVHEYVGEGFVAECLEIPGCLSQGETEAEALENIQDAIDSCLKVLVEDARIRLLRNASWAASTLPTFRSRGGCASPSRM